MSLSSSTKNSSSFDLEEADPDVEEDWRSAPDPDDWVRLPEEAEACERPREGDFVLLFFEVREVLDVFELLDFPAAFDVVAVLVAIC